MTKSGPEKKRVRRSPQSGGGGGGGGVGYTRVLYDNSTSSKKSAVPKDVYQVFAEKVRDNKQLESRWAIMQETRVEYFRGKDFTVFLRGQPELKEILGMDNDLDTEDIVNTLLRKNLIVRCDRVMKTVRPGKKKLSSWPAHLEIYPDQVFSENDAFFAWTFMKRRALWQTILSFLWPLVALAVCLFPVYPYQVKIVVLYSCAGALFFIAVVLLLRGAVFGALWILLGKRIWFFPNINAEETTFRELIRFWPKKDEDEPPKWTSRLTFAAVTLLVILLLRHHAPDEAARARYQTKVSNIIDDMLEWSPTLALSGMIDKSAVHNSTESNHIKEGSNAAAGTTEEETTHRVDDVGNAKVTSDGVEYEDIVDREAEHAYDADETEERTN